jgi:chromosomal replication initiation ATPase DnaA
MTTTQRLNRLEELVADLTATLRFLRAQPATPPRRNRVAVVLTIVSRNFDVPLDDLLSRARTEAVCQARWAAAVLLVRQLRLSHRRTAEALHLNDHSGIAYALSRADELISQRGPFAASLENTRQMVQHELGRTL